MDYRKNVDRTSRLVCLKMADKMPAHLVTPYFGDLFFGLLDPIFPDIHCTKFDQLFYGGRRMGLADSDQGYIFGAATGPLGGGLNPGTDARKSCCQLFLRRVNGCHRSQFDSENIITQTVKGRGSGIKIDAMVAHCGPKTS